MKKNYVALLLFACVLLLAACGGGDKKEETVNDEGEVKEEKLEKLRMGVIPTDDNSDVRAMYEPVAEYLQKETGVEVELFLANDYTAVIEAMKNDKIDIARLGAFSYILAANQVELEPLVAEVGKATGEKYYTSLFLRLVKCI